jgi:hypothetical protein
MTLKSLLQTSHPSTKTESGFSQPIQVNTGIIYLSTLTAAGLEVTAVITLRIHHQKMFYL